MKIGIIGAGELGGTLIRQYSRAGHNVKMKFPELPPKMSH